MITQVFSTESDERATTQHVAFPFDSCDISSSCAGPALAQLSRTLDTEAACGYVTLVNLARRRREEEKQPDHEDEEEEKERKEEGSPSPSAQNLGK